MIKNREMDKLITKFNNISDNIDCPHLQEEIITFMKDVYNIPKEIDGCIVEAGCYKGGSTSKFSLVAKKVNRKLVAFDSFKGIPANNEDNGPFLGPDGIRNYVFYEGNYHGTLEEVTENVSKFGNIEICQFIEGWFEDTLPNFSEPIVAIYLDVDLASSTKTCLKYLYPLLVPGGVLYSQDCHIPIVKNVFNDDDFWKQEVGYPKPHIERALIYKKFPRYDTKLIKIVKVE